MGIQEQKGAALKATSGWNNNSNGTDDYGFSALPAGQRSYLDGTFIGQGCYGSFWSSIPDFSDAWSRTLSCYGDGVIRDGADVNYGFSTRCVKD